MGKSVDLTGMRFGKLVVTKSALPTDGTRRRPRWDCLCDCGNSISVRSDNLRRGNVRSCGCLRTDSSAQRLTSSIGKRFGRLVVAGLSEHKSSRGHGLLSCLCDCGKTRDVRVERLESGDSQSCGCLGEETRLRLGPGSIIDIGGIRFGRLLAVERTDRRSSDSVVWRCICDCGRMIDVSVNQLRRGKTQSCGCTGLIDYDGYRFRSRWEVYWYIGSKMRDVDVWYEPCQIPVMINGRRKIYIPDFLVVDGSYYVEVKGRRREDAMVKLCQGRLDGLDIRLVSQPEIEEWCGHTIGEMYRTQTKGGLSAVRDLICG